MYCAILPRGSPVSARPGRLCLRSARRSRAPAPRVTVRARRPVTPIIRRARSCVPTRELDRGPGRSSGSICQERTSRAKTDWVILVEQSLLRRSADMSHVGRALVSYKTIGCEPSLGLRQRTLDAMRTGLSMWSVSRSILTVARDRPWMPRRGGSGARIARRSPKCSMLAWSPVG